MTFFVIKKIDQTSAKEISAGVDGGDEEPPLMPDKIHNLLPKQNVKSLVFLPTLWLGKTRQQGSFPFI